MDRVTIAALPGTFTSSAIPTSVPMTIRARTWVLLLLLDEGVVPVGEAMLKQIAIAISHVVSVTRNESHTFACCDDTR